MVVSVHQLGTHPVRVIKRETQNSLVTGATSKWDDGVYFLQQDKHGSALENGIIVVHEGFGVILDGSAEEGIQLHPIRYTDHSWAKRDGSRGLISEIILT